MSDEPPTKASDATRALASEVDAQVARRLEARRHPARGVWLGLGMMGLVGWSVVVPTLLGAALGLWLDARHVGTHAWTLALLIGGLTIGCLNAGYWVAKEQKAMHEEPDDDE